LLALFDWSARQRVTVSVVAEEPAKVLACLSGAFPKLRVVDLAPGDPGREQRGKVVVELDIEQRVDAQRLSAILENDGVTGVSRVTLED
jgi:hypothetical protein